MHTLQIVDTYYLIHIPDDYQNIYIIYSIFKSPNEIGSKKEGS